MIFLGTPGTVILFVLFASVYLENSHDGEKLHRELYSIWGLASNEKLIKLDHLCVLAVDCPANSGYTRQKGHFEAPWGTKLP